MDEHVANCDLVHPYREMTEEDVDRLRHVLAKVSYRDWLVRVSGVSGAALVQVCTMVPDSTTGEMRKVNGRTLALCPTMGEGFLIDLAFELIKEFELHELAERFSVDGVRAFAPHDASGAPLFEVPSMRSAQMLRYGGSHGTAG